MRSSSATLRSIALATLAVLGGVACSDSRPRRIVLITLDTTRADHIGAYGSPDASTPELDRFASDAVLFERAYSTSSWTLPAHASLFTGLLPCEHGAQATSSDDTTAAHDRLAYPVRPLSARFDTLAERLADAGYRTVGIVGGPALVADLGVGQGFEHYEDSFASPLHRYTGKRASEIADRAIHYLERFRDDRLFLFVNFYDPHAPYRPPPPFDGNLQPTVEDVTPRLVERIVTGEAPRPVDRLAGPLREGLHALRAGYRAEVSYMDHHLGRVLRTLASLPGHELTWIVITSDHGESFGEHYFVSHSSSLYEPELHVPLLVRGPGWEGGRRIETAVQNHRVFSTLLRSAGLATATAPALSLDPGASAIVSEVKRNETTVRLFGDYFDRDLRAIHAWPYKMIVSTSGDIELFDLDRDPGELDNLASRMPERVRELGDLLGQTVREHGPLFDENERAPLSPEAAAALRALGYID